MKKLLTLLLIFSLLNSIDVLAQTVEEATQACLCINDYSAEDLPNTSLRVFDKWNRDVSFKGLTLVDWEGPMGNPEILYKMVAPQGATYPLTVSVSVLDAPRVYFLASGGSTLISDHSVDGPIWQHTFSSAGEVFQFRLGINPDPDGQDETYQLGAAYEVGGEFFISLMPIFVCDQDRNRPSNFKFILDTSLDLYGFYPSNPEAEPLMQQIVDDIGYYLDDQRTDRVEIDEATARLRFDAPFEDAPGGELFGNNSVPFDGYYLFSTDWSHGTDPDDIWSTGEPGTTFYEVNGVATELHNTGNVRPHYLGDRSAINTTGWSFDYDPDNWWMISRDRNGPSPTGDCPMGGATCDYYHVSFYSIMKHELLHVLAYEPGHPKWQAFIDNGNCINDPDVMNFTGECTPLTDAGHAWAPQLHTRNFNQGVELIDKFEMLVMQAIGWKLRETTPFVRIEILDTELPEANVDGAYFHKIALKGGVGPYNFVVNNSLPAGLSINSFTGEISGTPTQAGIYTIDLTVFDNDVDNALNPNGTSKMLTLIVGTPESCFDENNTAMDFDGVDDYVALPTTIADDNWTELTIEAWVKVDATNGDFYGIVSNDDQFGQFVHFQMAGFGVNAVYTNAGSIGGLPIIPQTPTNIWRHVAMVVKSGDSKIFENGVQIGATNTFTFDFILPPGSLALGRGFDGGRYFNGSIADVRIWNSARTAQELQDHMLTGPDIQHPNLMHWYRMDQNNDCNTLYDVKNHENGTRMGTGDANNLPQFYAADSPSGDCANGIVRNTMDDGIGSLRQTIACAAPGATITFDPALANNPILLTSGEIVIDKNLTISGLGADLLTIDGGLNDFRLFIFSNNPNVTFENLTLKGGGGNAFNDFGSCIVMGSTTQVTMNNCSITAHRNTSFGTIATFDDAIFKAINCQFKANEANNCSVIFNQGIAQFIQCIIAENSASSANIFTNLSVGKLELLQNTIVNNVSPSAIIENQNNLNLYNNIFYDNTGGVDIVDFGCLIAYNNLMSDPTASGLTLPSNGNFVGNPQFVDAVNGDYRLVAGSVAVDAGDNAIVSSQLATDFGGNARIDGALVDIGAFELICDDTDTDNDGIMDNCDNCPTQPSRVLDFDGTNDVVEVDNASNIPVGNDAYTVEAWIYPHVMGGKGVVGWGNYGAFNQVNAIRLTGDGIMNYWWGHDLIVTTGNIANAWHHIAVTYDGTYRRIYLDGSVVGEDQPGTHNVPNANNLTIGKTFDNEFFDGIIDEVRIWDIARTQQNLQINRSKELSGNETGLVLYYDLNEGLPNLNNENWTVVLDKTSNVNTGTPTNFALNNSSSNWTIGAPISAADVDANTIGDFCQRPFNDHPCAAPVLGVEDDDIPIVIVFNSDHATTDVGEAAITPPSGQSCTTGWCDMGVEPAIQNSVWFRFTAPADGSGVFVSTCDFANYNTQIAVYQALDCGDFSTYTFIAANDDGTNGCSDFDSYLEVPTLNAGEDYLILIDGFAGQSGNYEIIAGKLVTLPLEKLSLEGKALAQTNLLKWETVHEQNTQTHFVERSADGKHFTSIGQVAAVGHSSSASRYNWEDKHPLPTAYYRIKTQDTDGKVHFSNTISIDRPTKEDFVLTQLYPNPTTDQVFIDFWMPQTESVHLQLTDITGKIVLQQEAEAIIGDNQITIKVQTLSAGTYFVRLTRDNGDFEVRKLVVQ